ncbi:hypothetical protein POTOM_040108 [Populus tomentosa]|uniref:Acyltransferase n=1 Tax=Populus tomentosa TaxID=118781 RepID=A0A8X7YNN3_POPTO|nr:hypothetical protein POTOM_040108 [Populus tomentosa]
MENHKQEEQEQGELTIFKARELFSSNIILSLIAVATWLGSIHFVVVLVIFSLLFLSFSKCLLVFGLLLLLVFVPIDDDNKLGRRLCRYICRHACCYFPVTLHVEDINAFHPDRAYVFGYEPHSVWPIGVVALADHAGFMPLTKVKVLASSAVFLVPFLRHIWTWCGLTSATKKNFTSLLSAGYTCIVNPGGVQETFYMEHDNEVFSLCSLSLSLSLSQQNCFPQVKKRIYQDSHGERCTLGSSFLLWSSIDSFLFHFVTCWLNAKCSIFLLCTPFTLPVNAGIMWIGPCKRHWSSCVLLEVNVSKTEFSLFSSYRLILPFPITHFSLITWLIFLFLLQSKVYKWWKPSGKLFLKISRAIKFTPVVFGGIFGTPLPFQRPMHIVVGRPIELKQNLQPTVEELAEVHGQFVAALDDLFKRHRARVGFADLELKIL